MSKTDDVDGVFIIDVDLWKIAGYNPEYKGQVIENIL
jgi:hypothetical protein